MTSNPADRIASAVREIVKEITKGGAMHDHVISMAEKPLIEEALEQCKGNQSRAALWLGLNRNTLRKLMRRHKVKV